MSNRETEYIRARTHSGDYYKATAELWKQYWQAAEKDDWDFAQGLEEGNNSDFFYDP